MRTRRLAVRNRSSNRRPEISLVGAGSLARALAFALHKAGYRIREIVSRNQPASLRRAQTLARSVGALAVTSSKATFNASIVWICVPDDSVAEVAAELADGGDWQRRIAVHASGALAASVLDPLKRRGAAIASAHPLMSFVHSRRQDFSGVPLALQGDARAMRALSAIARSIGALPFEVSAEAKPAYHAFGFFASPAMASLVAAAEAAGALAGFSPSQSRRLMAPIVRQTMENCFRSDPASAFSGPLKRGDAETIRKHLKVLKHAPELLNIYEALARFAVDHLPVRNDRELRRVLR